MTITFYELLYMWNHGLATLCKSNSCETNKNTCLHVKSCKIFVGRKRGNTAQTSHSIMYLPCELGSAHQSLGFTRKPTPGLWDQSRGQHEGTSLRLPAQEPTRWGWCWVPMQCRRVDMLASFGCLFHLLFPTCRWGSIFHFIRVSSSQRPFLHQPISWERHRPCPRMHLLPFPQLSPPHDLGGWFSFFPDRFTIL